MNAVPFVDRDQQCSAALGDHAEQARVLFRHRIVASITPTTFAESTACSALTLNFSIASSTRAAAYAAVSINVYVWPSRSNGTYAASRVVPGWSKEISRSSPSRR